MGKKRDFMEMELVGGGLSKEEAGRAYGGFKCLCRMATADYYLPHECLCYPDDITNLALNQSRPN